MFRRVAQVLTGDVFDDPEDKTVDGAILESQTAKAIASDGDQKTTSTLEEVVEDYVAMRLSLKAHPLALLRPMLTHAPATFNELPPLEPSAGLPAPVAAQNTRNALSLAGPTNASEGTASVGTTETSALVPAEADVALLGEAASGVPAEIGHHPENMDPVERLRLLINEREEETVQILRSWMNEDEGTA